MSLGGGAVIFVNNDPYGVSEGSSFLFVGLWLILYCLTFLWFFIIRFKISKKSLLVFIFPFLMILSSFWSSVWDKTFFYSVCFLFNMIFVLQVVNLFNLDQLLRFLTKLLIFMMLVGTVLYYLGYSNVIYFDIHGRETLLGGLPVRGLFNHKITAGIYSAFCFLLVMRYYVGFVRFVLLAFTLFFNLQTGSATGVIILVSGVVLYYFNFLLLVMEVKVTKYIFSVGLLVLFVTTTGIVYGADLLEFFGRDPTLTGRTTLWVWGLEAAFERPFFGWGYVGYNGTNAAGLVADTFIEFANYNVPHFHESYIQILVESGFVGFLIYIFIIFFSVYSLYSMAIILNYRNASLLCLSIFMSILISGGFVHVLSRYNNFTTIFIFLVFMYSLNFKKS